MTAPLFREAALVANRRGPLGAVALYGPPHGGLLAVVALLFIGSVAVLLCFGTYTARERAAGDLLPEQGVLNIVPPVAGTVTRVFVRDGQAVERGAPLLAVSSEIATGLGDARALISEHLLRQRATLELDLSAQSTLAAGDARELRTRAALLRDQLSGADEEISRRRRQAALARDRLARMRAMREQGYVSNAQIADEEAATLDAEVRVRDATRRKLEIDQALAGVRRQLGDAPVSADLRRRDVERQLEAIDQQLVTNEAARETVLRAPQAGTVGALLAEPGRAAAAGETLVALLPAGGKLQARLLVPSRAIGFIRAGDRVVLRYAAYPYQKFGLQYGHVVDVSRTALSPRDVAVLTGDPNARGRYYRVLVAPERQDLEAYGRTEHLRAGMALDAEILLERRRLVEWLFEPLYAIGRRVR